MQSLNDSTPTNADTSEDVDYAADNLPLDLLHPGGMVETIMTYINETAICQQPTFALAAALTLCGLLYGRRFRDESGQRTNLFFMGVGYTSAGKDHAIKSISRILSAAEANGLWISQVTSDSALEHALSRQPRIVLLIDEAGHFFSAVNDQGCGAALKSIKPSLLQIWSSADCCWKGKQRAPQRDKAEIPVEISCPHVCLLGMTQPQTFFNGASRADIQDGWLARPIFLISKTRPPARLNLPPRDIPDEILREVRQFSTDPTNGYEARIAPSTPEAKQILEDFNAKVRKIMLQSDRDKNEVASLYGKAVENARRIALTIAVGKNNVDPIIDAEDMRYGVALVSHTIRYAIDAIEENLAENELERAKKRLLKTIREAGSRGIVRKDLTRKSQYLKRQLRDECLDDLIEAGEIIIGKTDNGAELFKIA